MTIKGELLSPQNLCVEIKYGHENSFEHVYTDSEILLPLKSEAKLLLISIGPRFQLASLQRERKPTIPCFRCSKAPSRLF